MCINWFSDVEPSLNFWNKLNLGCICLYLLDLICHIFKVFHIIIYLFNQFIIFSLEMFLCDIEIKFALTWQSELGISSKICL